MCELACILAPPLAVSNVGWMALATGLALGAAVAVTILAIFGQRGRAEMTPEREVALAAGQADRRTLFESPIWQPVMWLLLVAARRLPMPRTKRHLREWLVAAGSPNYYTPEEYLAVAMLGGLALAAFLEAVNFLFSRELSVVLGLLGFLSGFGLMLYNMHTRAHKRVKEISRRVPYTLDLVSLAMGAGATFTEAVRTVVHEDPRHPFNVELNTVLAEVELGTTRSQALMNMSDRVPLEQLRSIVAAIIQAEGLGTPLSDVLKQQATLMRQQRSVRAEKLAAQASVRILVPTMLILLSVVLTIFGPFILRAIKGEIL